MPSNVTFLATAHKLRFNAQNVQFWLACVAASGCVKSPAPPPSCEDKTTSSTQGSPLRALLTFGTSWRVLEKANMGLFKEVKKPTIRAASTGAEVSSKRPLYVAKQAPCSAKCPMGNDVRDWLVPLAQHVAYGRSAAEGFATAWQQITEINPFPAICGRLCQHSCEGGCNRKAKDGR